MKIKLLASATLASLIISVPALSANSPVVVGYWSNWGIYSAEPNLRPYPVSGSKNDQGGVLRNAELDSQIAKLDIFNYAFLEVDTTAPTQDPNTHAITPNSKNASLYFYDPWADLSASDASFCQQNSNMCQNQDVSYSRGNFSAAVAQKTQHPNLKVQISVGGWAHDSSFEGRDVTMADPNNPSQTMTYHIKGAFDDPEKFANSLQSLVNHYHIDGIDLDYEPQQGFNSANSAKLVNLAHVIRQKLPNIMITMAVFANPIRVTEFDGGAKHNWQAIAKDVNYINIMGYDMHGSFDNPQITGLQSGLYFDANEPTDPSYPHFNSDIAVKAYLAAGIPAEKLVLGIPSYARAASGVPAANNGLFQRFTSSPSGDLGAPGDMESYYGIVNNWLKNGSSEYVSLVNGQASGAWSYNPTTGVFASYDNPAVIDTKVKYIKENGLGGIMMWELRSDLPANQENSLMYHMAKVKG